MAISKVKRGKVWAKSDGICWYCGCKLDPDNWHIDHMIPKAKRTRPPRDWRLAAKWKPDPNRGTDALRNLFPSCPNCNQTKTDLSLHDFKLRSGLRFFWFEKEGKQCYPNASTVLASKEDAANHED